MENGDKLVDGLAEIEFASDEVVGLKHQLVLLDMQRQKAREALRAFPKQTAEDDEMISMWMGNMFIKFSYDKAKEYLEKEMRTNNEECEKTRTLLKEKVRILQDLQGQDEWRGFRLNPLTGKELKNVVSNSNIFTS